MPTLIPQRPAYFPLLDHLKVLATALIVLHHLAFYGPLSDFLQPLLPTLMTWLQGNARIAVQVFLVVGGFLAAQALSAQRSRNVSLTGAAILRRFNKLTPPFAVATVIAVFASVLAAQFMQHPSVSPMPSWLQLAAHFLLLHKVLGYDSLWAGAWYIAIDFQLYALLALVLWQTQTLQRRLSAGMATFLPPFILLTLVASSLFYFNLQAAWDDWAPYFFGSYGLGSLAFWASQPRRSHLQAMLIAGAMLLICGLALQFAFRSRIAFALGIALLMIAVYRANLRFSWPPQQGMAALGRISYAVFLVHFPVCLLTNALVLHYADGNVHWHAGGLVLAFFGCWVAGAGFHLWIERPLAQLAQARRSVQSTADEGLATP